MDEEASIIQSVPPEPVTEDVATQEESRPSSHADLEGLAVLMPGVPAFGDDVPVGLEQASAVATLECPVKGRVDVRGFHERAVVAVA